VGHVAHVRAFREAAGRRQEPTQQGRGARCAMMVGGGIGACRAQARPTSPLRIVQKGKRTTPARVGCVLARTVSPHDKHKPDKRRPVGWRGRTYDPRALCRPW